MATWRKKDTFLAALDIEAGDIICLTGAGGKTSLLFQLALEAREKGLVVLITTTTRMLIPEPDQYNQIDLSGNLFAGYTKKLPAGIYAGGIPAKEEGKMNGTSLEKVDHAVNRFDLVLIEADGAACKRLKGWRQNEPVIPSFATKTIGVVDIATVGLKASEDLVHRLELFRELTGTKQNATITTSHLGKIITGTTGLFQHARGERRVFLNRMTDETTRTNGSSLRSWPGYPQMAGGCTHAGIVYG